MWCRFIPAGAGNTAAGRKRVASRAVHPRRCGEHDKSAVNPLNRLGSSPQVRGTRNKNAYHPASRRFIPAGAGNTNKPQRCATVFPVHPRRCGEHAPSSSSLSAEAGSSPQVRGTPQTPLRRRRSLRFIPAGAGNTPSAIHSYLICSVHPRRCGEHCLFHHPSSSRHGSSPQVRGTRHAR